MTDKQMMAPGDSVRQKAHASYRTGVIVKVNIALFAGMPPVVTVRWNANTNSADAGREMNYDMTRFSPMKDHVCDLHADWELV